MKIVPASLSAASSVRSVSERPMASNISLSGQPAEQIEYDPAGFFCEAEDGRARMVEGAEGSVATATTLNVGKFGEDVVDKG